jgi:hypothetical protein
MITVAAKLALLTSIGQMVTYIDQVGTVPSRINSAHAEASRLADRMPEPDRSLILAQIDVAEKANQEIGAKLNPDGTVRERGMLLSLRESLMTLKTAIDNLPTEEEPPVDTRPPPLQGFIMETPVGTKLPPLHANSGNHAFPATPGTVYEVPLAGPADRVGMSADNGAIIWGAPGQPVGQASNAASENGHFVAGDVMYVGIPVGRAPMNIIYSAMKYGG